MLSNPEVTGRLLKWRFKLEVHDIHYRTRTSVKGQILTDFIVERSKDDTLDTPMEEREELPDPWVLFTVGSSCIKVQEPDFGYNHESEGMKFSPMLYGSRFNVPTTMQNLALIDGSSGIAGQRKVQKSLSKCGFQTRSQPEFSIKQVPRGENKKADALSKIPSTSFAHLSKQVLVEELKKKSIDEKEVLAVVEEEEGHTWMTPVYEYLTEGILPEEKRKARVVRRKAGRYAVINETLYKKSFLGPWLRCVGPLQANYVLREIYEGSCMDAWIPPSLGQGSPQEKLTPITSPWPFYKWGIDIAGPFPEGPGKIGQNLEVYVDDLVIKSRTEKEVIRDTEEIVERANRSLGEGIKARLAEAVILVEIGMPTLRTAEVDMIKNNEALGINLDLLEERREQAAIQEARSKAKMEKYYNARVRSTSFHPGDLVYRNNEASHAKDEGKLGPKWEGPYEVMEALGKGAYKLRDRNGNTFSRTW
ncbi:reverse transcriptase domain-containing protein, partial [Tanacetum coccineum]